VTIMDVRETMATDQEGLVATMETTGLLQDLIREIIIIGLADLAVIITTALLLDQIRVTTITGLIPEITIVTGQLRGQIRGTTIATDR